MITLVFAVAENWLLGSKNKLPWHIKEDLKHFNSLVKDKTVLMGLNTYYSLTKEYKVKLRYPKIYIASKDPVDIKDDNVIIVGDVIEFLKTTKEDIFVIGGKMIYELSYPYADTIHVTYILNKYEGDIYLNPFNFNSFKLEEYKVLPKLIFAKYRRIK